MTTITENANQGGATGLSGYNLSERNPPALHVLAHSI